MHPSILSKPSSHRAPKPTTIPPITAPGGTGWKGAEQRGKWKNIDKSLKSDEKFIKVHRNFILSTQSNIIKGIQLLNLVLCSVLWWKTHVGGFWTENWKWLKYAKLTCGFISNHLISCQLCFLLPSSCALHARSKSPAVPRAAPWVDEGHLPANLMTTSLVFFLGCHYQSTIYSGSRRIQHANFLFKVGDSYHRSKSCSSEGS